MSEFLMCRYADVQMCRWTYLALGSPIPSCHSERKREILFEAVNERLYSPSIFLILYSILLIPNLGSWFSKKLSMPMRTYLTKFNSLEQRLILLKLLTAMPVIRSNGILIPTAPQQHHIYHALCAKASETTSATGISSCSKKYIFMAPLFLASISPR